MPMTPPGPDELMDAAEPEILACLAESKPVEAAAKLVFSYRALRSPAEREAFVAALALHVAIARSKPRAA